MTTDLHERLVLYGGPAPALAFDAGSVIATGRARRRRRRVTGSLASAACLAAVGAAAVVLLPGGTGPVGVPGPTYGVAVDPPEAVPPRLATGPDDVPRVLRDLAADALPGATETLMRPSRWTMEAGFLDAEDVWKASALPLTRADEATAWTARFDRGESTFAILTDHTPPDQPRSMRVLACGEVSADLACEVRQTDDGAVMETWMRVEVPGAVPPRREHTVVHQRGETTRTAIEILRGSTAAGPLTEGFSLSSAELEAIATDERLGFPLPTPAPPLPSIDNCLFSYEPERPSPDCP